MEVIEELFVLFINSIPKHRTIVYSFLHKI
jgi:hypothetical protein